MISAVFLVTSGLSMAPSALPAVFGWIALAALVYFYRVRKFERKGVALKAQMSLLHNHEQVDAGDD